MSAGAGAAGDAGQLFRLCSPSRFALGAAELACGLAPTLWALLAARALLGAGAALEYAGQELALADVSVPATRARTLGVNQARDVKSANLKVQVKRTEIHHNKYAGREFASADVSVPRDARSRPGCEPGVCSRQHNPGIAVAKSINTPQEVLRPRIDAGGRFCAGCLANPDSLRDLGWCMAARLRACLGAGWRKLPQPQGHGRQHAGPSPQLGWPQVGAAAC